MANIVPPEPGDLNWAEPLNGALLQLNDETVNDGEIVDGHLILKTVAGGEIDAGQVQGEQGIQGPPGPPGSGDVNSVNGDTGPDVVLNAQTVGAVPALAPVPDSENIVYYDPATTSYKGLGIGDNLSVEDGILSADIGVLDRAPNPFLTGSKHYSFGHSYVRVPSPYTTPNQGEYPVMLSKRLGMAGYVANGRGGTPLVDQWSAILADSWGDSRGGEPTIDRTWVPGTKALITHQNYMNEMGGGGGVDWATPQAQTFWGMLARSFWSYLSCSYIRRNDNATFTGTGWVDLGTANIIASSHSGGIKRTATPGDSVTYSVNGDSAYVIMLSSTGSLPSFEVYVNGVSRGIQTLNGIRPAYTSVVDPTLTAYTPISVPVLNLPGAASALKDIRIVHRGPNTASMHVNGCYNRSSTPPPIFFCFEPPREPSHTTFPIQDPLFRATATAIASEFSNVHLVDLAPGWDNSIMISSKDPATIKFHPNDIGHLLMTDHIQAAVNAVITEPNPGTLTI